MNMIGLFFPTMGMPELLIILTIIILLFGAKRLPDLAKGLGQSIRAFKQASTESATEEKRESGLLDDAPKQVRSNS